MKQEFITQLNKKKKNDKSGLEGKNMDAKCCSCCAANSSSALGRTKVRSAQPFRIVAHNITYFYEVLCSSLSLSPRLIFYVYSLPFNHAYVNNFFFDDG